jgi:hypothetical protein
MTKPPLDIEQTLDLVLAATSHRSQNEKHSQFGKLIIDQYFVNLKEQYKDDETARKYLDNILISAASAVRAFSVVRDIFGTRWQSLAEQKKYELERINKLDDYSPFKEKGYWGKIISIISGAGIGSAMGEAAKNYYNTSNILILSLGAVGIAVGLFAFDFILNIYRERRIKKINLNFPETLESDWKTKTLKQYKSILKDFLISAIKIREQYYPELPSILNEKIFEKYNIPHIQFNESLNVNSLIDFPEKFDKYLDEIINRHFSLNP